ncbi:MAG: hypothetical protein QOE96_816 [Blastocatellia bacterium]|jgi:hypothetical protein|nr:hypothetical protein [Blastocatellia bacterium]
MSTSAKFLWGVCGSVAVEVITLYQAYHSHKIAIPERYRRKGFWCVRFALSLLAGGLAVAYDIDKPLLALNIGAATPLIFQALAQGYRDS